MRVTGKRHPYLSRYRAGFSSDGRIEALSIDLYSDGGCAADLSLAVMERSMLHTDNAYFIPNIAVSGTVCRTNLPSNTAMRGFGGPQGIAAIENVIEEIAAYLGIDALEVRRRNCYGGPGRDTTPYGQVVANNTLPVLIDRLAETADYDRRRDEIARSNAASRTQLRGLALTPVKFGISFTRRALNQANALVNIYLDGTIQVSTGGTEMGQGLNTKIRQIVAGRVRAAARGGPGHAGLDREEQQHLADGRVGEHRLERDGRSSRRRNLEGPARRGGCPPFRVARRWDRAFPDAHPLRARGCA